MMKNIIISLIVGGLLFGYAIAYEPTSQDVAQIRLLKTQLDTITTGNMKDKRDFYAQLKTLQEQFTNHEQLQFYFDELGVYLLTQVNNEKVKSKIISKTIKQDFWNQWSGWFSKEIPTTDSCTGRYNTMDTISFANNFPTALMLATWYRETNCGYYLPANGDGPFQIVSKDYGTGQITEAKFLQTMQEFIDFSKGKIHRYNNVNEKNNRSINLTYTGFDITGIINYWTLYNSISWTIYRELLTPTNPKYVYDGYGQDYSGALRYGLVPKFLKILDREIKNSY